MQHPANRSKALFADPYETANLHSKMDTDRRDYVVSAMQKALDSGTDGVTTFIEGVKTLIEFTLNYFTATITADNVHRFSASKSKQITDRVLQDQLISRERMKLNYVHLKGKLRDLKNPAETKMESISRSLDLGKDENGNYFIAPPSPERQPITNLNSIEMLKL